MKQQTRSAWFDETKRNPISYKTTQKGAVNGAAAGGGLIVAAFALCFLPIYLLINEKTRPLGIVFMGLLLTRIGLTDLPVTLTQIDLIMGLGLVIGLLWALYMAITGKRVTLGRSVKNENNLAVKPYTNTRTRKKDASNEKTKAAVNAAKKKRGLI